MKVLIVDDDAVNRLILQKLFEKKNNEVKTAKNGLEALSLLVNEKDFNIVITDIMMPEMDGIELLAEIKLNDITSSIPIIGFTAGDIEYFRKINPITFDKLLPKPMDYLELYNIACRFVNKNLKPLNYTG